MIRLWKEVLCLGRQCDRFGRWFEITPAEVGDAKRNASLMLSRGVPVPTVWEHQDIEANQIPNTPAAVAEWKRRYAKFCFGHIGGARVNGRGNLELLHEVPDPADAKQLQKVKFCSPKLYRAYSDSRGGKYRGTTIAHVAATPTPVQYWQRPFELSQGDALYLSYTPPEEGTVADDADDKGKTKGGAGGDLGALMDALREKGMTIPDEVKDIGGLIIAIKAGSGAGGDTDLDLDDTPEPGATDADMGADAGATAAGPSAPMLMSDARAEPFRKMAKRDLATRIKNLLRSGRVDRPTAQKLLQKASAVELSFTTAGELTHTPLVAQVEAYEQLPKGLAFSAKGGKPAPDELELSTTRVDAPKGLAAKAAGSATDWLCAGLPAKK
jgi:hypothetical protein